MLPIGGESGRGSYAEFRVRQIAEEEMRTTFDDLREFCLSLGSDVIEDVRPHRVVFCKSMNTRWFVDAKPEAGTITVKTREGWRDPVRTTIIKDRGDWLQDLRDTITQAHAKIR